MTIPRHGEFPFLFNKNKESSPSRLREKNNGSSRKKKEKEKEEGAGSKTAFLLLFFLLPFSTYRAPASPLFSLPVFFSSTGDSPRLPPPAAVMMHCSSAAASLPPPPPLPERDKDFPFFPHKCGGILKFPRSRFFPSSSTLLISTFSPHPEKTSSPFRHRIISFPEEKVWTSSRKQGDQQRCRGGQELKLRQSGGMRGKRQGGMQGGMQLLLFPVQPFFSSGRITLILHRIRSEG